MGAHAPDNTRVTLLHRLAQAPEDHVTWGEFVAIYGPVIRGWCLGWGLQEADSHDVTQNVLLKLTAKLPRFKYNDRGSFRGWLKTLTHHAWHDFVTEVGYRHRGAGDSSAQEQLHSVAARDDLAARLEATFDRELLDLALVRVRARVAAGTWEAFKLSALDGLPAADVAAKLGVRTSQVYLAKHRVQKMLQELIQELEGGAPAADPAESADPAEGE